MKKIVSLLIVIVLMLSVTAVAVSAQEIESKAQNVLHFDVNTALNWGSESKKVYCHIWELEGDMFYNWQSKKENCSDDDHDGVWAYDLDANGIVLEDNKVYGCIFSNESGKQTANLIFDKTVLGDTAYCDDEFDVAPGSASCYTVYWKNQGKGLNDFGPQLYITAYGEVCGTCIPTTTSAVEIFEEFLKDDMDYARNYTGKDDQSIIDNIAVRLELTKSDVVTALSDTQVNAEWSWYKSETEMGDYKPVLGDADGDSKLSILDATAIQMHIAKKSTLPAEVTDYADTEKNNESTILDATKIQFVLAKKTDTV